MIKGSQPGFDFFFLKSMIKRRKCIENQYRGSEYAATDDVDGSTVQHGEGYQKGDGDYTE